MIHHNKIVESLSSATKTNESHSEGQSKAIVSEEKIEAGNIDSTSSIHSNSTITIQKNHHPQQKIQQKNDQCDQTLIQREKAVIANISIHHANENMDTSTSNRIDIDFPILLHHPSVDQYITQKILKRGTYEPEMEQFLFNAFKNHTASSTTNTNTKKGSLWAVDIGANIGFHSLHMASLGVNVIAFEPAPDTYSLIQCSADLFNQRSNHHHHDNGSLTVIQAGASNVSSKAHMYRHPDSPGMTTFRGNTSFPLEKLNDTSTISIVTVKSVLMEQQQNNNNTTKSISMNIPNRTHHPDRLWMLKVDVEGMELQALQGLDLKMYPFRYLTFEFFPLMLRESGNIDPLDLILYVRGKGYGCNVDDEMGISMKDMKRWLKTIRSHINVYCELNYKVLEDEVSK